MRYQFGCTNSTLIESCDKSQHSATEHGTIVRMLWYVTCRCRIPPAASSDANMLTFVRQSQGGSVTLAVTLTPIIDPPSPFSRFHTCAMYVFVRAHLRRQPPRSQWGGNPKKRSRWAVPTTEADASTHQRTTRATRREKTASPCPPTRAEVQAQLYPSTGMSASTSAAKLHDLSAAPPGKVSNKPSTHL